MKRTITLLLLTFGLCFGTACREVVKETFISQRYKYSTEPIDPNVGKEKPPTDTDRLADLQAKLRKTPNDAPLHYLIGRMHVRMENFSLATRSFIRVTELMKPDSAPDPYYWLGWSYLRRGLLQQAKEQFIRAVKVKPDNPDAYYENVHYQNAWFSIGKIHMLLKEDEEAKYAFLHFIEYGGKPDAIGKALPGIHEFLRKHRIKKTLERATKKDG